MWVYCAGELGAPSNILFEYQPTRHGDHAAKFLGDYSGHLVCDGYAGYNKVKNVTRCGCFAHVRRKYVDALPKDPKLVASSKAAIGVDYCNRLFKMEKKFADLTPEERHKQRQEQEKPLLDAFFAWAETLKPSGKTALAKAVAYTLSEKKHLMNFLDNPLAPISNNRAENAIRPFVIGRKGWLFCNSVKGAQSSAIFYSLAATATANGINAEQYFTKLFQTLPFYADEKTLDSFIPEVFLESLD